MSNKLLFDIGANIGAYSQARWDTGEYSKIIAIDANELAYQKLSTRFEQNDDVIALYAAVGEHDNQSLTFYQTRATVLSTANPAWLNTPGHRFHGNDAARIINEYQVQQVSIDKLIRIYGMPDLIKIDVEGYEETAVKGLSQRTPELCFEWAEEMSEDCIRTLKYLHKLGYQEYAVQHEDNYIYQATDYQAIDNFDPSSLHTSDRDWGMVWVR